MNDKVGIKRPEMYDGIRVLFSKEPSGTYVMSFVGHPGIDDYMWKNYSSQLSGLYTKKEAFYLARIIIRQFRRR